MQLHGIIVEGREVLHDQFSLKEVWQAVEPFSAPYREMLSHLKKTEVELRIEVLLNFLEGKESPAGRSEARRFLEKELPAGQAAASWLLEAGYGTFVEKNKEKIRELSETVEEIHSLRGAALLCLFLMLHIQAGRDLEEAAEDRKDSGKLWEVEAFNGISAVEYMKKRLHQEALPASRERDGAWGEIGSGLEEEELVLPFWTGAGQESALLETVWFENRTEKPVQIRLAGTSLTRQVFPEERLYLLRKGAWYVDFLPRFQVSEELCFVSSDRQILWRDAEGAKGVLPVRFDEPLSDWAYEEGTWLVGVKENGQAVIRGRDVRICPDMRVVKADVFGPVYGILQEDGTLLTNVAGFAHTGGLLAFQAGLNCAAGIQIDRSLLGAGSSIWPEENTQGAVEIRGWEDHVIWLDQFGGVHTDMQDGRRWKEFIGAHAVEICQKGYLIAWKNQICLVSFGSGEGRAQSAVVLAEAEGDITEIAASDRLLAYRSDADQEIRLLSLES